MNLINALNATNRQKDKIPNLCDYYDETLDKFVIPNNKFSITKEEIFYMIQTELGINIKCGEEDKSWELHINFNPSFEPFYELRLC